MPVRLIIAIAGLLTAPLAPAQPAGEADADFDAAFADFDEGFEEDSSGPVLSGFVELAGGRKTDGDPLFASRDSLAELRARMETEWAGDSLLLTAKLDLLYDDVVSESDVEPRELSLSFTPAGALDMKLGRQVLTWGTGDLLFLNDLFPKSWISFFSGREDEYLKAPSDAVRATWYNETVNVDLVWSPDFEPDDYLTGERFSFFSPLAGGLVAPSPPLSAAEPDDDELALRLFRTVGSTEYAAYFYRGFFKRPLGLTAGLAPSFPPLSVAGGSLRRPLGGGVFNAEFAYHRSRADTPGSDPLVPNDQFRLLAGYEFEVRPRLNLGLQYYLERTMDHYQLIAASPTPRFEPARNRHLLTSRLTWRDARDRLTLSLFTFYSPTDDDYHLRPSVDWRLSDRWSLSGGANLFGGQEGHTFFGQLEAGSNAWLRARFNY